VVKGLVVEPPSDQKNKWIDMVVVILQEIGNVVLLSQMEIFVRRYVQTWPATQVST